jgi:hypothetical protein
VVVGLRRTGVNPGSIDYVKMLEKDKESILAVLSVDT